MTESISRPVLYSTNTEGRNSCSRPPILNVVLKPKGKHDGIEYMDVFYEIEDPKLTTDDLLAYIHLVTASIPVCEFSKKGLIAWDDDGQIPVYVEEGPGDYGPARKWIVKRETNGNVRLTYRVFPRRLPDGYRASPYFDLRNEEGGANGAGVTFMVLLPNQEAKKYQISLAWDLREMQEGDRGVWSMGEGRVEVVDEVSLLAFSFYAVGAIKSYYDGVGDRFAMYWLSEPSFDPNAVAQRIKALFDYMSDFFDDPHAFYRVFVRKDPFEKSEGGTALRNSFMFGWSDSNRPTPDSLQNLLAHEMVHNWIGMEDPDGTATWFNEGCAEYYSVVLPFRAGLSIADDVVAQLAVRSDNYYGNPLRHASNEEAFRFYWSDRNAQRLPYGRGFIYLVDVDARIRKASGGRRSVDNVVLELMHRKRKNEPAGVEEWIELVTYETGVDEGRYYESMKNGTIILPREDWFSASFKPVKTTRIDEDGNEIETYRWEVNPNVSEVRL